MIVASPSVSPTAAVVRSREDLADEILEREIGRFEMNQRSPAPGASPQRLHSSMLRPVGGKPEVDPGYVPAAKRLESEEAVTLERGRPPSVRARPRSRAARSPATAASRRTSSGSSSLPRKTISIGGTCGGSPSSPMVISRPDTYSLAEGGLLVVRRDDAGLGPKACLVEHDRLARQASTTLRAGFTMAGYGKSAGTGSAADAIRQERGVATPAARTRALARDLSSVTPSARGRSWCRESRAARAARVPVTRGCASLPALRDVEDDVDVRGHERRR